MPFARTKIQQPRPRAGLLLARPDLERALVDALLGHRCVLVCAMAGYGKTALLGRAVGQLPAGTAAAWISLDEGDDLHRLLSCLLAALEPFDPPWRTAPEGLIAAATRPGASVQAVADEIVNTLDACETAHGVIVLDDLQHLNDPASLAFLDHWLQRMSPRWTLAIAARQEPALRLTRLRAAGELAEFREAQLQFARDEVRMLAADAGLDAEAADALHARTAGWAAGLRLGLNGARGGSPNSAMDRHAFEFLATEVLARIDPGLRDFLLRTSMLHDLDAPRCAAVTGDALAAHRLDEVERLGLFVTMVDEAMPTLRLHDLFRDALGHRLKLEQPEHWPALFERAAMVETDPLRQQSLLLAAGRYEQAARMLMVTGIAITAHGGAPSLLQLVEQFPPEFARSSPELQRATGMAKWSVWETREAERHLALAEELFAARGDHALAEVVRGHRAVTLVALGRRAEAGALAATLPDEPAEPETRIVAPLVRTWHALEGCRFHEVAPHFDALVRALETQTLLERWYFTVPPPRQTACRGIGPALLRWARGALQVVDDRPLPLRGLAQLTLGWHALWQGRLGEAAEQLQRAEDDAQWTGERVITRHQGLAMRAVLQALNGERDAALATIHQRLGEQRRGYGDWGLWHALFFGCRVAAACNAPQALRDWLQRLRALQPGLPEAEPTRLLPAEAMQGTLAALEGRIDEAVERWRSALAHENHIDLLGQGGDIRVRLAQVLLRRRALAEAAALLRPLLADDDIDGPAGALFAGDALRELAAASWGGQLGTAEVATLARWAALLPLAGSVGAAPAAAVAGDDRLSPRELEVLAQIADGASNKLIARALDLSPHTVKRHVAHILDKLALTSRGQAAAWFRKHVASAPMAAPLRSI